MMMSFTSFSHQNRLWLWVVSLVLMSGALATGQTLRLVAGAGLNEPFGVDFDSQQRLYVVEMAKGNRLLRLKPSGGWDHVAGKLGPDGVSPSGYEGDMGPGDQALFNGPHGLAILPNDDVLIADTWNGVVRRIESKTNDVSTEPGFHVPMAQARKAGSYAICLTPDRSKMLVANLQQIHEVDLANGRTRVIAGNGQKGCPPDGAVAAEAPLTDPRAVAVDSAGRVYILERDGHALRVVEKDKTIRTVVNASGKKGASGDGGSALAATMNGPKHLCIDKEDRVIIADAENHLIRRYDPKSGLIQRLAGTGKKGSSGLNGDPLKAELSRPHGVTIHPSTGHLYITDSYNNRILKIEPKPTSSAEAVPRDFRAGPCASGP